MNEMKKLGERISLSEGPNEARIEITQKIETWKLAVLNIWLLCWLFCGVIFFLELNKVPEDQNDFKWFLGILLGVWGFIFYRILRVAIWRIAGKEIITFSPGKLHIKNAFGSLGKNQEFNLPHIPSIKEVKDPKNTFFHFMDKSFWVIGDNKFEFSYSNRTYQYGKQLEIHDIRTMKRLNEKFLRRFRKS